MLINIVAKGAAAALIGLIESSQAGARMIGALLIRFSAQHLHPSEDELMPLLRPILEDKQASVYLLDGGDAVVTWHGAQRAVLDKLKAALAAQYQLQATDFSFFDVQAHGEDLRQILKRHIAPPMEAKSEAVATSPADAPQTSTKPELAITDKDIIAFRSTLPQRKARLRPEILIVEDQAFSRKILIAALGDAYQVHEAADAEAALGLYLRHAPDLVFLDIELPGMDGHHFARIVGRLDPQAYIVMVTGNSQMDDIQRAKDNAAKGFIVKPFTKQRILDTLQKFTQSRR